MNLVLNSKGKDSINQLLSMALKCMMISVVVCAFSMMCHVFNSAFIEHVHGKPEFVKNTLFIYSFIEKNLLVVGYLVLGYKIPIRNTRLRALVYTGLVWGSDFLPQIMGLAGADGEIARMAFSLSTVICDSLGYLAAGIMIGIVFKNMPGRVRRHCNRAPYIRAIIASAAGFPILVIVVDQIIEKVYRPFSSVGAMGVSDKQQMLFYISFYSWFILSGALLAVFYRLTEYNEQDDRGWLKFAIKYIIFLWTPIVLIMIVFGTEIMPTIAYTIIFAVCITMISWVNKKILEG